MGVKGEERRSTLREDMERIVTPFLVERWEEELTAADRWEEFRDVTEGMREGFSLGLEDFYLTRTFVPPNHAKEPEHLEFIEKQYGEEIEMGRLSKGYTREEIENEIGMWLEITSPGGLRLFCRVFPDGADERHRAETREAEDYDGPFFSEE